MLDLIRLFAICLIVSCVSVYIYEWSECEPLNSTFGKMSVIKRLRLGEFSLNDAHCGAPVQPKVTIYYSFVRGGIHIITLRYKCGRWAFKTMFTGCSMIFDTETQFPNKSIIFSAGTI